MFKLRSTSQDMCSLNATAQLPPATGRDAGRHISAYPTLSQAPFVHLHAAHVCGVVQRLEADVAARRAQRIQHSFVPVHSSHCHVRVALQAGRASKRVVVCKHT